MPIWEHQNCVHIKEREGPWGLSWAQCPVLEDGLLSQRPMGAPTEVWAGCLHARLLLSVGPVRDLVHITGCQNQMWPLLSRALSLPFTRLKPVTSLQ